jgi:ubiquinone/menaquinone biosynthesis C-methylase UbiE
VKYNSGNSAVKGSIPVMADDETASADYASRFASPVGRWMLDQQSQILRELIAPAVKNPPDKLSILDVGGGHAQVASAILDWLPPQAFKMVVAGSTEQSRRRLTTFTASGGCKFVHADLLHLPYPDRHFEIVSCFRLLPHCDQWKELIQELCRVASHSVIVDYPTNQSVNFFSPWLFKMKKRVEQNTRPYTLFHRSQIRDQFKAAGFRGAGEHPQFFWPMALHRLMKNPPNSERLEALTGHLGLKRILGSPIIAQFIRDN